MHRHNRADSLSSRPPRATTKATGILIVQPHNEPSAAVSLAKARRHAPPLKRAPQVLDSVLLDRLLIV
ncbi:hypothetical protein ACVWXM_009893 [Bradyrhizobium sp. GM7.3]